MKPKHDHKKFKLSRLDQKICNVEASGYTSNWNIVPLVSILIWDSNIFMFVRPFIKCMLDKIKGHKGEAVSKAEQKLV